MTRKEALEIVEDYFYSSRPSSPQSYIECMEKLGVLKLESADDAVFKEAGAVLMGKHARVFRHAQEESYVARLSSDGAYEVLDVLRKNGFKVVRDK